jgi:hypothetical protein
MSKVSLEWKKFDWINLPFKELDVEEGDVRLYKVSEDIKLPSMTSVLSVLKDEDGGLEQWIERVGKEEATKIVDEAIRRGNSLHDLSERYLKNQLTRADVTGPGALLFNRSKRHIDALGPIVGVEVPLYNIEDGYAGRTDCIAFHGKDLCVVDHKNSRRKIDLTKDYARKKLFGYMVQTCGYGRAFAKMFPHLPAPTHGILIVGNVAEMSSSMFKFKLAPLEKELDIVLDAYYNRESIKKSSFFRL